MGLRWRGATPNDLATRLKTNQRVALKEVEEVTQNAVTAGAKLQREFLDQAITAGGQRRVERGQGNSAGRNDTGKMIADIDSEVSSTETNVTGKWGWINEAEQYYAAQDLGTDKIPAAHSLLDSYISVREQWIRDIKKIVGD